MRELLQLSEAVLTERERTIHVPLKELPPSLRDALKRVGYGSRDVGVVAQERVEPNPYAGEGQKGFVLVVDIASGKARDLEGGWGGARPDEPREIDFASKPVPIPPGGAIVIGTQGYPQTMATIYVHPESIAKMLPAMPEITDREQMILRTIRSLTSAGRKEIFANEKVRPEEIDALVQRKLLAKSKAGAVSITTTGKNVAEGQEDSMRVLLRTLEEATGEPLAEETAEVDTTVYEFSHGKKPRGFGSWAFSFNKKDVPHTEMLWVNQSTYGDALKQAKAEAKKRGAWVIYPQP